MRGVLEDCFQITGRPGTVVAVLIQDDELVRIGDWMIIDEARLRITGIEFIKRTSIPTGLDLKRVAFLVEAPKAELMPLIGKQFETASGAP